MKQIVYILLFIAFLFPPVQTEAQSNKDGIQFFHGSWDEAILLAEKEKKGIFIDFFTEWCGPCLTMAVNVFTLSNVGEVYNSNFICLKMDAEKGEGKELAKRYKIGYYPTYIFVNPETEELIHRSGGNKPASDFIADIEGALNPKLSSIYLNKKYASGKYDIQFLKDYIKFKKRSGGRGEIEKIFTQMLEMGAKLTEQEVWDVYVECVSGYRNPYVKQVSDNYDEFVKLFGKKTVDEKLSSSTSYAPVDFTKSLCDFEGKHYNLQMAELTGLFRSKKMTEAWKIVDKMIADTTMDQYKFVKTLSFYVRINPKYIDSEESFETLVNKMRYMRYVAYNMYERDDAYTHYLYATGLEYLIQRSIKEGEQIPVDFLETPKYGKKEYDMRHPLLKLKPKRR